MAYVIFDLDGTVIDSDHRYQSKADGTIDLQHWFDNATPEMTAKDRLLPLARAMRSIYAAGHTVIICTARCFQAADHKFLRDNNIPYHELFTRQGRFVARDSEEYATSFYGFIGDGRSDEIIKAEQLETYFRSQGFPSAAAARPLMFDDNLKIIAHMNAIGIKCVNARSINRRLRPLQELVG